MTAAARLPAAERRRVLVETAIRLFTEGSYRGTTTAEIAHAAGVSEPVLYRHFESKRELYLAALDHVWRQARAAWEDALACSADARSAIDTISRGVNAVRECKLQLAELWVQALTEAAEDDELRRHLRRHMREVHAFAASLIRRGQEEGAVAAERDPEAEAWIFVAGAVLGVVGRRVGLLDDEELGRVREARLAWLKG